MRYAIFLLMVCICMQVNSQQHSLEKIWETDSVVAVPESVLPVIKKNLLFVSLIDGGGWIADGKGGVAKIGTDGKNYQPNWITGLNAPKGMGIAGNKLYVADISEVVVIDVLKGKIEKKIAIDSATGLNDITVDNKGAVYVSDSRRGKIWRIINDLPALYLDNVKGVNGLKSIGDELYIGAGKNFIKAGRNKVLTTIAELPQGIDGIEPAGNGDFILTSWAGYIFYVSARGTVETMLDTHLEKSNTADIGYDPVKKIVYVPAFNAKRVAAYRLLSVTQKQNPSTEIVPYNSTGIARITNDSIIVITGSTYSYTVDTPENEGLVSIKTSVEQLLLEITSKDGSAQKYKIISKEGVIKEDGELLAGDQLIVTPANGKAGKTYYIGSAPMAVSGQLKLAKKELTAGTTSSLVLYFTAGQRTPNTTVKIYLPAGIEVTGDNTTVNVIGRGDIKLNDLATQSIGRVGPAYPYHKVGNFAVTKATDGTSLLLFKHLDLRPANGADLKIVISNVKLKTGKYLFKATYTTSKPEVLTSPGIDQETAILTVTAAISDFERIADRSLQYIESPDTYTKTSFRWAATKIAPAIQLMQSTDQGKTWVRSKAMINPAKATATISGLAPDKLYLFRLSVKEGEHKGLSNTVSFYSGKMDVKNYCAVADGQTDNTAEINAAINYLHWLGGGTLLFSKGTYNVRTVHLKSNVWLYVSKDAVIKAIKGADAPEATWFSDRKYRSGLSPTDAGPYADPENYMTKQDVGHHYFRNTMFFGERLDNVKIIGNGLITGNGNLVTGDRVMNNAPDNRADKMFTLKLCTNLEIGGIYRPEDLWYDSTRDEPYYINKDGSKDFATDNMLHVDRAGHFALLATGTDNINVHDTYFAKYNQSNARDIYDFMECNNVTVTNIYSKVSSDDIVKPGSDCSLGFTRPARNYKVRNIIGDTNCNLFQIGSETADDIMDVHVDNIYVLGANKAGFSISTNDGAHIKDIHLNCGHTGTLHSRSKMYRTFSPFFISISNRGRILGATVARYKFDENGVKHDELLNTNINIGVVENIIVNGIDVYEVYAGSSYGDRNARWKAYDGSQRRATPIVAGYKLPDSEVVEGGLNFKLPNGNHTGYIRNIVFNDVHVFVKGGNPLSDTTAMPPELGVGQYNVSNLKTQPSYGLWARHVKGLTVRQSSLNYEKPDGRYAIFLDDVIGGQITGVKMARSKDNTSSIKFKNSSNIIVENPILID